MILHSLFLAFLAAGAGFRTVTVDAAQVTGKIRSFQGVIGAPRLLRGDADLIRQYKNVRIDFIGAQGVAPRSVRNGTT